jgi:PAS domain S-box-containing protein
MSKRAKIIGPQTEAILESISDGVFTVDADWRITSFNRAAEGITGITRDEALGQSCCDVFRSSMCEGNCALRKTLKTGRPVINQAGFIVTADGRQIPISVSTAVLHDRSGLVIGGAETFRDLSEIQRLRTQLKERSPFGEWASRSPATQRVFELAAAVAKTASSVLISGETGTGKELLARAIHDMSDRAQKPFVAVNCGALPDTLLESELFGYKKGAFTGADRDKPGRFELARGGTLFLDEIGEISPAMQVRLLRVLQEHEFEPLGATRSVSSDVRIITATNRNLAERVQEGLFRQDLFFRIHIIDIVMPPLRERSEDIPFLVSHFIEGFNNRLGRSITGLSSEAMFALMAHQWPGNIRELENVIERGFVLCDQSVIGIEHLPQALWPVKPGRTQSDSGAIRPARDMAEVQSILAALERTKHNHREAARELGIHKTTLYRKMKRLGMDG